MNPLEHPRQTCDTCLQPLSLHPHKLDIRFGPMVLTICPTCASLHAPLLHALGRKSAASAPKIELPT